MTLKEVASTCVASMRVIPETENTSNFFWTMATNPVIAPEETLEKVIEQTALTFDEDKIVIEAQYKNMIEFSNGCMVDIHIDVGANRARKVIENYTEKANLP